MLHQFFWHLISHLQAHDLTAHAPFAQTLLQGHHQVVGLQFAQLKICIAGHTEEVVAFDRHAWEQTLQVEGHQLLQRYRHVARGRYAAAMQFRGDTHEPRQVFLRHLDAGELPALAVWIPHQHRNVQAQVADERERVGRIHRQRRQHWKDGGLKEAAGPVLLPA